MKTRKYATLRQQYGCSLSVLVASGVLVCSGALAQTISRTALPTTPVVVSGNVGYQVSGSTGTITNSSAAAIVKWGSFDIGADAIVRVNQAASATLLNRVEGSATRTTINGLLQGAGHVYVYNPNGILIGNTAKIDVNTFVGTSLNIDNDRFLKGILAPDALPVLSGSGVGGAVVVEAGARITAVDGGKIILAAPTVTNSGTLTALDGQVILAAGDKVYLTAPKDTTMRGFLVEVGGSAVSASATNTTGGQIQVGRGNATMVGYAVNQLGLVSATTSVNLNGSVYLHARDSATKGGADEDVLVGRGGNLVLGSASVTQVLPTLDDTTTAKDTPAFKPSVVDLAGSNLQITGAEGAQNPGAKIVVPGGNVTMTARANPSEAAATPGSSRVDIGTGSVIDVSGTEGTQLAMESNVMTVELRGGPLADNVLLRNSPLRGTKANIDIRKGTQIANVDEYLKAVEQNVGQRTATGGNVKIESDGQIIQRTGSLIDVSGGYVDYLGGYINTTKLTANGALYDIGTASANRIYDGSVNLSNSRSNYEEGYREGKSAGTIRFSAPTIVQQGRLAGSTTIGKYQRELASALRPLGGKLEIDNTLGLLTGKRLVIGGTQAQTAIPPAVGQSLDTTIADQALLRDRLDLDTAALTRAGFTRFELSTKGDVDLVAPATLAAGASLTVKDALNVHFQAGVTSAGGNVAVKATNLDVADGVAFDLAAKWTNDKTTGNPVLDASGNPVGDVVLNGGTLDLSARHLTVGANVTADVSGGAWLRANGKLQKGSAGKIAMQAVMPDNIPSSDTYLRLGSGLRLSGYGMASGGALTLLGQNVTIGGAAIDTSAPAHRNELWFSEDFFQQGGFSNYDLGANANFVVAAPTMGGVVINPKTRSWQFSNLGTYQTARTGTMASVAAPVFLELAGPQGARPATNVTFRAKAELESDGGKITFANGARLVTDPGASVKLLAGRQITFDGTIDAPAGDIALALTPTMKGGDTDVYYANRSIWLGSSARILAKGTDQLLYTDVNGITTGELRDGGRVRLGRVDDKDNLFSAVGYLVAEQGSEIDVSGALTVAKKFKYGNVVTTLPQVASAGGSIDIRAREGILWAGDLQGSAGGVGVAGGSLTMALDREAAVGNTQFPQAERIFTLSSGSAASFIPAGVVADQAITGRDGEARVSTAAFKNGGFDRLSVKSENTLALSMVGANGNLEIGRSDMASVVLDAPTLQITHAASSNDTARVLARYAQIGNSDYRTQDNGDVTATASTQAGLQVQAQTIDLIGNSAMKDIAKVALNAANDIRLIGVIKNVDLSVKQPKQADLRATGALDMVGELTLSAAQVYPTTLSEFTLGKVDAGTGGAAISRLVIAGNGSQAQDPLAAAGRLTANAAVIEQGGRIVAPLGTITLAATDTLTYKSGSETSVSAAGAIPFGRVENGRDWLYDYGNGNVVTFTLSPGSTGSTVEKALPEKAIVSKAPTIVTQGATATQAGAVINVSGGGELYGYEFTPGPGGSKDVLAKSSGQTVFAINPSFRSNVAPRDFQYGADGGLQVGESVYLSGMPGLPAGYYTLLPAHYALLPGGYSISAAANTRDMTAANNTSNLDGSMLVAGKRAVGLNNTVASRTSGFVVSSQAVVKNKSAYTEYYATPFFQAQALQAGLSTPGLPVDAGLVAFDVSQSLALAGTLKLGAASGGHRGSVDISAPQIAVVADHTADIAGAVNLLADDLTTMGADSLMLGGLRTSTTSGADVRVGAQNITVRNNAAHVLRGSEIILAAQDTVLLEAGAKVQAQGTLSQAPTRLTILNTDPRGNLVGTDGAMLKVSAGAAASVVRINPAGVRGTLDIRSGATVATSKSLYFDATLDNRSFGNVDLSAGASVGLGAQRISLGDAIPANVAGLHYDTASLATLSNLAALELNSYSTIDLYGSVTLGSTSMNKLELTGQGFQAYGSTATPDTRNATFTAKTVRFEGRDGSFGTATTPPVNAAGQLTVNAQNIEIGNGTFQIRGFANTALNADQDIKVTGTQGRLQTDQQLTLTAARITAASGADGTVAATGLLALHRNALASSTIGGTALGGSLRLEGSQITSDARIQLASGEVVLASQHGVAVTGGEINASGASMIFGSSTAYAPGGHITLDGGDGNVIVAAPAVLDVSSTGAAAGTLTVSATHGSTGTIAMDGTLRGAAAAGEDGVAQAQGNFSMDVDSAGTAAQFTALNARLNAGGFTESRNVRVRHADVELASDGRIQARRTVVAADNGSITVAGTIDASGPKGGSIELYAAQAVAAGSSGQVKLTSTAVLDAQATALATTAAGSQGDGGRVVLGTSNADGNAAISTNGGASITIDSNARILVSGSGAGQNGTVTLRAPRIGAGAGSDVAIGTVNLDTVVRGSAETVVEAYKVYTASTISAEADSATNLDATTAGNMHTQSTAFVAANAALAAPVATRLSANGNGVKLRPGVEVRSTGDLTVSVNEDDTIVPADRGWNLNPWRYGNKQPGVLTLRAAGDLNIEGSISDGFVKGAARVSMPDWQLQDTATSGAASWSYRFVGGADASAANPMAVQASNLAGDVNVKFVRTETSGNDQAVAIVRTGTGRIDLAAARDFRLDMVGDGTGDSAYLGAVVYTVGSKNSLNAGFSSPANANNANYGSSSTTAAQFAGNGGAIDISAGRDVIGAPVPQLINNWLFRQGWTTTDANGDVSFLTNRNTAWYTRYDYFNQGIATFGGGDLRVYAKGNIADLTASVATNAYMAGTTPGNATFTESGGGDLNVTAGGNILGGSFYVQKGVVTLAATGSVIASTTALGSNDSPLNTQIALGDAQATVTAGKGLAIEAVYNPTMTIQSAKNISPGASYGAPVSSNRQLSNFSTYSADSAVTLTAMTGDVTLSNRAQSIFNSGGLDMTDRATELTDYYNLYLLQPGSFGATAMTGDIRIQNGFTLAPSSKGQLSLLARGNVQLTRGSQPIVMLDVSASALSPYTAPRPILVGATLESGDFAMLSGVQNTGLAAHDSAGLHRNDTQPARIVALEGDVTGEAAVAAELLLPKRVEIMAGRDVRDMGFAIQHAASGDITLVQAGRDVIDTTLASGTNIVQHVVTGSGAIEVIAGRNVDLGNSRGIVTRGNLDNPNLAQGGASISLVAGTAAADYAAYVAKYVQASDLPQAVGLALQTYVRQQLPGREVNSTAQAWALFKTLPTQSQTNFIQAQRATWNDLFFAGLVKESKVAGLVGFDALISTLFPTARVSQGDINVFASQLKTIQGGDINLFTPGGSVFAGLTALPAYVTASPADLGIFTVDGGEIRALVKKDFLVNQGRVFTLGTGDITLVSQYGDIDAGKGTKTASSAPPPLLTIEPNGDTKLDISGSVSGSGIATLTTKLGQASSNIYPVAPRGAFDAGDAGLRSSGKIEITAAVVRNSDNLSAGGGVSGAVSVDTGSMAAVAPANATPKVDDAAKTMASQNTRNDNALAAALTVDVLGYGPDNADDKKSKEDAEAIDKQKKS